VRPVLRRLLALALLLALSACGSEDPVAEPEPSSGPPPLSSRELGWIRGYALLAAPLYDGSYQAALSWKLPCLERLERMGEAPTARLRPAHAAAREVCDKLGTGGVNSAAKLLDETYGWLGRLFLTGRPLRVAKSPDAASHVDLTLGELASHVAATSVEVRCWSARDWRRLVVEENAWDATDEDPEVIDGLALTVDGHMHLLLADCNLLARVTREDVTERRGEDLVAATAAVALYAHEVAHFVEPDEEDEAEVECAVVETIAELADGLELAAPELERVTRAYRAHVRPDMPEDYLKDCEAA
jgi:hypothetical protein